MGETLSGRVAAPAADAKRAPHAATLRGGHDAGTHDAGAEGRTHDAHMPPGAQAVLGSSGQPMEPPIRRHMEARFGRDLSQVRLHTNGAAAESARSVGALAYAAGSHVVFGAGRYEPGSAAGERLLAHELTHVLQSPPGPLQAGSVPVDLSAPGDASELEADRAAAQVLDRTTARPRIALKQWPPRIHRATADNAPAVPGNAAALIREDDAPLSSSSQMGRSAFLEALHASLCAAVQAAFEGSPYEGRGCPFVERAIGFYRRQSAASIEASIHRYAPEAATARSAGDYVEIVTRRVRAAVDGFVRTGRITGIPTELEPLVSMGPLQAAEGIGSALGRALGSAAQGIAGAAAVVGGALAGAGRALRALFSPAAGRSEAAGPEVDPVAVQRRLGRGSELDAGVRSRMGRAFGHDFSHVRVHADERAAGMAESLGARALTVGSDVAFASGEYRPGTVAGDALIAHELAHTVQQQDHGTTAPAQALEAEADESAAAAVASIWGEAPEKTAKRPRRRTGLRLQRCASSQSQARVAAPTPAQCAAVDPAQWRRDVRAANAASAGSDEQARLMLALVQQALCGFGRSIRLAGTSNTSVEDTADYVPVEQGVNFDVRLNDKQRHGGGSQLTGNAGHSFSAGANRYLVLGPRSLDANRPDATRFIYEHELFHVEHHLTREHRRADAAALRALPEGERQAAGRREDASEEVEAYSAQFPSYFHLLGSIGNKPDGTIGYAGELWTALLQNYDRAGSDKQDVAFRALSGYYRGASVERQTLFVEWLRLSYQRNAGYGLVQRLGSSLGIDLTVAPRRWRQ